MFWKLSVWLHSFQSLSLCPGGKSPSWIGQMVSQKNKLKLSWAFFMKIPIYLLFIVRPPMSAEYCSYSMICFHVNCISEFSILFIYLKKKLFERQENRERGSIFCSLSKKPQELSWTRLKSEARDTTQVSHTDDRTQVPCPTSAVFLSDTLTGSWSEVEQCGLDSVLLWDVSRDGSLTCGTKRAQSFHHLTYFLIKHSWPWSWASSQWMTAGLIRECSPSPIESTVMNLVLPAHWC